MLEGAEIVIKPLRAQKNSFAQWVGAYPAFKTPQERKNWLSDLRDDDDRKDDLQNSRQ